MQVASISQNSEQEVKRLAREKAFLQEKNDNLEESFATLRSQHEDLLARQAASHKTQREAEEILNRENK